jgi:dihydrofolate reductase
VRRLIESTFVTLAGDIGAPQEWGPPYLDCPEADAMNRELLFGADALVLGRKTYEGLSAAYTAMAAGEPEPGPAAEFVARMNAIPKYVASRTLTEMSWNAAPLGPDTAGRLAALRQQGEGYLLKYGTGPLDRTLLEHGLVDEFRIWLVPVTTPPGQRLFEDVGSVDLELTSSTTMSTGVVVLSYSPRRS